MACHSYLELVGAYSMVLLELIMKPIAWAICIADTRLNQLAEGLHADLAHLWTHQEHKCQALTVTRQLSHSTSLSYPEQCTAIVSVHIATQLHLTHDCALRHQW